MKTPIVLLPLAALLGAGVATADVAVSPSLDLHTCQRVLTAVYGAGLPLQVDKFTVRQAVECRPGVTRPVLIHHEDRVQEDVSAEEIARLRPAVQRSGRDNAMVRQRCAQPAFRAWLQLADMAFALYVRDEALGTVLISADMCDPGSSRPDMADAATPQRSARSARPLPAK